MTDWTDDFMNSSQFPDRPNHPDFWRLAEIVLQLDGAASETGTFDLDAEIDRTASVESTRYMASQRALRALMVLANNHSEPNLTDLQTMFIVIWIEAFLVGARFQERGGRK